MLPPWLSRALALGYLAGGSSYSGTTTVSGGALYINGAQSRPRASPWPARRPRRHRAARLPPPPTWPTAAFWISAKRRQHFLSRRPDFRRACHDQRRRPDQLYRQSRLEHRALATSSTAGLITIDANLGSATVLSGTYDLISYTGSIGGAGLAAFTISVNGIGNRQTASFVNVSNKIELVVTGSRPFGTAIRPTGWPPPPLRYSPATAPTTFQTGDSDIFDDQRHRLDLSAATSR